MSALIYNEHTFGRDSASEFPAAGQSASSHEPSGRNTRPRAHYLSTESNLLDIYQVETLRDSKIIYTFLKHA